VIKFLVLYPRSVKKHVILVSANFIKHDHFIERHVFQSLMTKFVDIKV